MGIDVAIPPQRYNIILGAAAPFLAAPPSKGGYSIALSFLFCQFGLNLDERQAAASHSKWRPFIDFVIFCPIEAKFGSKTDCKMGSENATPLSRYRAIGSSAALILAAIHSKWQPFNFSVIFWPVLFKFGWKVDHRIENDVAMPPQCYGAVCGTILGSAHLVTYICLPIWLKFGCKVHHRMGNDDAAPPQWCSTKCSIL